MKRVIITLLALVLATAGLAAAAPAQAVGTGLPTIQSPAQGAHYQLDDLITFTVDYSNAPADTYHAKVVSSAGSTITDQPWETSTAGDAQSFSFTPGASGSYQFTVSGSASSELAHVSFIVEKATPPPPPPAPVIKRPSAPRSAHTTVASKKARLLWAAPASAGGAAIMGYQVMTGKTVRILPASYRSFLFTKLKNKRLYSFSVRAKNRAGWSAWAKAYGKPLKPRKVKKKKHHAAPKPPAPSAQSFANCDAMHQVYPHGVGRPGAVDNGGVTDFYVSAAIYNKNTKSDRDKDGVACEA